MGIVLIVLLVPLVVNVIATLGIDDRDYSIVLDYR